MHPFSVLTLGIFVAGYITARWDLVTRLYELAIFAWDHGVVVSVPLFYRRKRMENEIPRAPVVMKEWAIIVINHNLVVTSRLEPQRGSLSSPYSSSCSLFQSNESHPGKSIW